MIDGKDQPGWEVFKMPISYQLSLRYPPKGSRQLLNICVDRMRELGKILLELSSGTPQPPPPPGDASA